MDSESWRPSILDSPALPGPAIPAESKVERGYQYRQKGMRALGDGVYASAARFFLDYRNHAETSEPDFTDATILLLRTYLLLGDLAAARRELDYHEHNSGGTEDEYYRRNLIFWRAVLLVWEGEYEQGIDAVKPLLEGVLYPELQEQILLLLGDAYAGLANWERVREVTEQLLEEFPDSVFHEQASFNLFKAALALEDHELAEFWLAQAVDRFPEDAAPVVLRRIILQLSRDQVDRALASYQIITDHLPPRYERDWWLVFGQLADRLLKLERWPDALPVIRQGQVLAPTRESRAGLMFLQAECEIAMDDQEAAEGTLNSLISLFPDHENVPEAYFKLALLAVGRSDYEAATEFYERIFQDSSMAPELRYQSAINLGQLNMDQSQPEAGLSYFTQAHRLALDSRHKAAALMLAGNAGMEAGDYTVAAIRYQLVADQLKETEYAGLARLYQARARVAEGRMSNAATVFRQFINENPGSDRLADAWLGKATALREAEQLEQAITVFEQFVTDFSDHDKVALALMEIYRLARDTGDMARSMRALNQICTNHPESELYSDALYHRAYLAFQVGDYDLAVTESERIIGEFSDLPKTADVLLWLADYYRSDQNFVRAEERYRQVARLFPESEQGQVALYEAASVAVAQDAGSEQALLLLEELDQNFTGNHDDGRQIHGRGAFLRGDVLASRNQFEEAIEWFGKASERLLEPTLRLAANGRIADMYFALASPESYQRAATIYRDLKESDQLTPELQENITYRLAKTLEQLGELEEALDLYLVIVFNYDIATRGGRVRDWYYFARAGYDAARLLIGFDQPAEAVQVYERIYQSGIPAAEEARGRAFEIHRAHQLEP